MLNGYHLRGVEDEYILVFKTDDPEVIRRIIDRLLRTRDKDLCELAQALEKDWNERERERQTSKARPQDKGKASSRRRTSNKETRNPEFRT